MEPGIPLYAVVGKPVLHSRSPELFRLMLEASGLRGTYARLVARDAVESLEAARAFGLAGFNVTAPFKTEIAARAECRGDAALLGSANCVRIEGDGRLLAECTDTDGVAMPLLSRGMAIDGTRCLVIGAGGAGRAAVLALSRLGGKVVIANRTESRARDAARLAEGGAEVAGLGRLDELSASCPVIVSAVPPSVLSDPSTWFRAGRTATVIDADYREGALASFARERGCEVVDGLEWLASQALGSFEFLAGRPAPVAAKTLVEALRSRRPRRAGGASVALIGLSGSGKTAIGERLALRMGARFIDVDARVERRKGMTVPEIFAREGESAFRALEKEETLRACALEPPSVIATGGGAPEDPEIARALHSRSTVAWLHASAKTLASRISPGSRPLLGDADPLAALERLFARRRDAYATVADLCVATDRGDPDGVAELLHAEVS